MPPHHELNKISLGFKTKSDDTLKFKGGTDQLYKRHKKMKKRKYKQEKSFA